MKLAASIEVSYSQLAVFWGGLKDPFSDWSDEHVAQGFAWRPGSVSFRTILETGTHQMEIVVAEALPPPAQDALRVIRVPFEGPASGRIEIASISDGFERDLHPGLYQLQCEFFPILEPQTPRVRLCFCLSSAPVFEVPVVDDGLSPPRPLSTTARAAAQND